MNDLSDDWSWDGDLFRLLAENIKDYAIFLVDTERRVRSWTAGVERLLGYSEEEILGQTADIAEPVRLPQSASPTEPRRSKKSHFANFSQSGFDSGGGGN